MALRARGLAREVVGVTRVPDTIPLATRRGAIDRGTSGAARGGGRRRPRGGGDAAGRRRADGATVLPGLRPGAILTDVASVKGEIVRSGRGVRSRRTAACGFVGGHPMAGNEGRGIEAAAADLFEGTVYLVTPTPRTDPAAVERLADARARARRDPDRHGPGRARPHGGGREPPSLPDRRGADGRRGGGGAGGRAVVPGRDARRRELRSSMWTQICRLNREPITEALKAFQSRARRARGGARGRRSASARCSRAPREARAQVDGRAARA